MELVDYQELFASGDLPAIKQAASKLSCRECLTAIKTSKRYDLCRTLLPRFKLALENREEGCELYVCALVDGRKKELGSWTSDIYVYENTFSFYCGKYALPIDSKKLRRYTVDFVSYYQGVVDCDNVELLKTLNKPYWHRRIVEYSAFVFAPKCMEYFLQVDMSANLDHCLAAVLKNYNRQSMKYLCTFPEAKSVVTLEMVPYLGGEEGATFLRWLLAEKLLQFSDADWEMIRIEMPVLYTRLQNDV